MSETGVLRDNQENFEHLEKLCSAIARPNLSVKHLNTLYQLRNAWASKRYLNAKELSLMESIYPASQSLWEAMNPGGVVDVVAPKSTKRVGQ